MEMNKENFKSLDVFKEICIKTLVNLCRENNIEIRDFSMSSSTDMLDVFNYKFILNNKLLKLSIAKSIMTMSEDIQEMGKSKFLIIYSVNDNGTEVLKVDNPLDLNEIKLKIKRIIIELSLTWEVMKMKDFYKEIRDKIVKALSEITNETGLIYYERFTSNIKNIFPFLRYKFRGLQLY